MKTKTAVINRGKDLSTLNNKAMKTAEVLRIICKSLKAGKAKKLVDTDNTLAYQITK